MEQNRPNKIIHEKSEAVRIIGVSILVLGCACALAGLIWLMVSANEYDPAVTPLVLLSSGIAAAVNGAIVMCCSPLVRAAETYLYDREDHPIGDRKAVEREIRERAALAQINAAQIKIGRGRAINMGTVNATTLNGKERTDS